ncbi:Rqt4 protein [Saccharomycopsis crataegensis]|uniref:Rqt4 protein n=1 Tax=Saccharomycopsis crataegensis TaxID=43959 RepID=A0AAV5QPT7_9ASCO|nr:Rqt4 protein [Saccharomycopsis crataegensis]
MALISKATLRKKLFEILPLDNDSLDQAIDYSLTLKSNQEIAGHFTGLAGDSPLVIEFINDVISYRDQVANSRKTNNNNDNINNNSKVKGKTQTNNSVWSSNNKDSKMKSKPVPSTKQRLSSAKSSHTVSQLVDQTPTAKTKKGVKTKNKAQKLNDISDLDELLNKLEYGGANSNVKCDCMAVRHGLNRAIPNCLNCGKIICMKESGRTTCSFCDKPLISLSEKLEMVRLLQKEKEKLMDETTGGTNNSAPVAPSKKKKEKLTISMGAGSSFFSQQDKLFASIEKKEKQKKINEQRKKADEVDVGKLNDDLAKAQSTLNKLLGYQENSTARTKIIDQVSDYSLPSDTNIWTKSSLHKILELKKQQRNLKKKEKLESERGGRGKKFISLNVKGGKVTIQEASTGKGLEYDSASDFDDDYENEDDDEAVDSEDEEIKKSIKELESKIKDEEKDNEKKAAKQRWDYSKDLEKWKNRQPRYTGIGNLITDDNAGEGDAGDDNENQTFDRLQTSITDNAPMEELMLNL